MAREQKEAFVNKFRARAEQAHAIYFTDFTGLNVKSMTTLRREIKRSGGEYLVAKNRLMKLALAETQIPDIAGHLTGPTGVVFGDADAVQAAKAIADFAKENEDRPAFKVGVLDGSILDAADIARIARLPSKEVLLSEVAGALGAPLAALAGALESKIQEFAGLVEALCEEQKDASAS